jgi:hypothetical protein
MNYTLFCLPAHCQPGYLKRLVRSPEKRKNPSKYADKRNISLYVRIYEILYSFIAENMEFPCKINVAKTRMQDYTSDLA